MGISAGGGRGKAKSDINVTPLVDVVLVLLIIFLVTMPIMMRQITIEVPRKLENQEILEVDVPKQITVTLKNTGVIVINDGIKDDETNWADMPRKLAPLLEKRTADKVVFVDIEEHVPYGDAVQLMDVIKGVNRETTVALKIKDDKPPEGAGAAPAEGGAAPAPTPPTP